MNTNYTWEINATNPPLLIKKCSHCSSDRYYCSEKFRLNAQKKNIDVWLIYRCINCDSTTNMTILSRVKASSIDQILHDQLSENATEMAWKYAFSDQLKHKNKVDLDYGSVAYTITYDGLTMEDILRSDFETIHFKIDSPLQFNLKLSTVIRNCLAVSSKQFGQLIDGEVWSIQGQYLQKNRKVKHGEVLLLDAQKLKQLTITKKT